jgi:hypothetical protein
LPLIIYDLKKIINQFITFSMKNYNNKNTFSS